MTSSSHHAAPGFPAIAAEGGIWGRQLDRYPSTGKRTGCLVIAVLATITLYYELYVQGSVATTLAANLHMTVVYLISISIVGNAVRALASVVAGWCFALSAPQTGTWDSISRPDDGQGGARVPELGMRGS
jgi:hypothetical protein